MSDKDCANGHLRPYCTRTDADGTRHMQCAHCGDSWTQR